jgi:hypothetical protein
MSSILRFDEWQDSNGVPVLDGTGLAIPSSALPTGTILQVQQAFFDQVASTTSTTFVDVTITSTTYLSLTITPVRTNSKFLVIGHINTSNNGNAQTVVRLVRNAGTDVSVGNFNGGSDSFGFLDATNDQNGTKLGSVTYLDSPSTPLPASLTYRLQYRATATTSYINRNRTSATQNGSSSLTVLEIGA